MLRHTFFSVSMLVAILSTTRSFAAAEKIDFNRDIRPLLSDNCFTCHGPDENKRKAKLRLDIRDEALKPGKSGVKAFVPGKAAESELIKRLASTDDDERMPPDKKKFTPEQVELFKKMD